MDSGKGKIKVGVVGTGRLGSEHARVYAGLEKAELVAVSDTDPKTLDGISRKYEVGGYPDYRSLAGLVDAVSIAVPTEHHYETAKFFLSHNVNVLLEKPITRTLREADSLVALARKRRLVLQVGHIERFNGAFRTAGKFIKNPRFIECHRLSPFPGRGADVSVILDLMIHDIDIVLSLVKSAVKSIHAVGVSVLTPDIDIANARIVFSSGAVANVTSSRVSREKLRKIRVFSENTYVSIDCLSRKVAACVKNGAGADGIDYREFPAEEEEPLALELRHFTECVLEGKPPMVSGTDAREALKVALAVSRGIKKHEKDNDCGRRAVRRH